MGDRIYRGKLIRGYKPKPWHGRNRMKKKIKQMQEQEILKTSTGKLPVRPKGIAAVILAAQGDRCAICGCKYIDSWHLDHDHSCPKANAKSSHRCEICIRGVLCSKCNMGLGQFGDSIEILLNAIKYLENHRLKSL